MPDPTAYGSLAIFVLLAAICVAWSQTRHGNGWRPVFALGFRLLAFLFCALLFRHIFRERTATEENRESKESSTLVVLEDVSASMQCRTSDARTRTEMSREVLKQLQVDADDIDLPDVDIHHLRFAQGLLEPGQILPSDRNATQLAQSFLAALSKTTPSRMLIISDGAHTGGPPPAHALAWAHNRGIGIHTICTCTVPPPADIIVEKVSTSHLNPTYVEAKMRFNRLKSKTVDLDLTIDGQPLLTIKQPIDRTRVRLPIPELGAGWHHFRLSAKPIPGEMSVRNNTRIGVFQIIPDPTVLYLAGAPSPETAHMARLLRELFPDRVLITTPDLAADIPVPLESVRFIVAGDIAPRDFPPEYAKHVMEGRAAFFLHAGYHLPAWSRESPIPLPVEQIRPVTRLSDSARRTDIFASKAAAAMLLPSDSCDKLTLSFLYPAQKSHSASTLLSVAINRASRPLLVVDKVDAPRIAVLLSDMTWKWHLAQDPAVRNQARTIFRNIFNHLLNHVTGPYALRLHTVVDPDHPDRLLIDVLPVNPSDREYLSRARIRITEDNDMTILSGTPIPGGFRVKYDVQERPAIVWIRATALIRNKEADSVRRPFAMDLAGREYLFPDPRPEALARYVTDDANRGHYTERDIILQRLFRSMQPKPRFWHRLADRKSASEIPLALGMILCLGLEWFLERSMRGRRGAS